MKTFSQLRATFLEILAQLKHLEGTGTITRAMYTMQEREAGKLCYQVEEDLSQEELSLFKEKLQLKESTWNAYKKACIEGLRP